MRRIVLALLALIVAVSMVGGMPAVTSAATPYVELALTSGYIGDYDEYHVTFLLNQPVSKGSTIAIGFDKSVNHSPMRVIATGDVLLDGVACSSVSWSGHTMTVTAQSDLIADAEHTIVIQTGAMVQNPQTAMGIRVTLSDTVHGILLTSNYCMVNTSSAIAGISMSAESTGSSGLTVSVRFRTGRNGSLKGTAATWSSVTSLASYNDTLTLRLSNTLSKLWAESDWPTVSLSTPPYGIGARQLRIVSTTIRNEDDPATSQRIMTFIPDVDIPASTEVLLTIELDGVSLKKPLTTDDYVAVWTSKEPTMVTIRPGDGGEPTTPGSTTEPADTAAPTVTWTSRASTLLPRLVTLNINVTEVNLDEAWFSGGTDSLIHTRLAAGDNAIMLVNRTGIHGTIVATDKAGNTTIVPVDLPAPSMT
ncbi:MAG TPA: hypothetical protein VN478_03655 [Clostridia bacterium]|nr:hypothetical protein [Clostridia bacterium]